MHPVIVPLLIPDDDHQPRPSCSFRITTAPSLHTSYDVCIYKQTHSIVYLRPGGPPRPPPRGPPRPRPRPRPRGPPRPPRPPRPPARSPRPLRGSSSTSSVSSGRLSGS